MDFCKMRCKSSYFFSAGKIFFVISPQKQAIMAQEPSFSSIFRRIKPYLGQGMVFLGALLLFAGYLLGWTANNVFLVICVLLILVGIRGYVSAKKAGR